MPVIQIKLHAEAANRDDPDFAALRQHPRYKDAVKILQERGLRPQGVRGYPMLLEILQQFDANTNGTKRDNEPLALANMRRDLESGLVKLRERQEKAKALQDADAESEEYAEALRVVQEQLQYVAGLRKAITRLYDRYRKQKN